MAKKKAATKDTLTLPYSDDAERYVLGAMLQRPDLLDEFAGWLHPQDFYRSAHQFIYAEAVWMRSSNQPVELIALTDRLRETGKLEDVGGPVFLTELIERAPIPSSGPHYAHAVKRKSIQRQAYAICALGAQHFRTASNDEELQGTIEEVQQSLFEVMRVNGYRGSIPLSELSVIEYDRLIQVWERARAGEFSLSGLGTGYEGLDELTGGFHPGELVLIAGRTAMGKTTLICNIMLKMAQAGVTVGLVSVEMPNELLMQKWLAMLSGVNTMKMRSGKVSERELPAIALASDVMKSLPIYVDDTPSVQIADLRARARRMVEREKVQCLFVDYLQKIKATRRKADNREQEVAEVAEGLKTIARDLRIPVVAAAQLSREVEQRGEAARPKLSDLRESGRIEQEADVVLFLYHDQRATPAKTLLYAAKQRMAAEGDIQIVWKRHICRFEDPPQAPKETSLFARPARENPHQ